MIITVFTVIDKGYKIYTIRDKGVKQPKKKSKNTKLLINKVLKEVSKENRNARGIVWIQKKKPDISMY